MAGGLSEVLTEDEPKASPRTIPTCRGRQSEACRVPPGVPCPGTPPVQLYMTEHAVRAQTGALPPGRASRALLTRPVGLVSRSMLVGLLDSPPARPYILLEY